MIPSKKAHLQLAALSHPGMTGKNNEDQYAISAYHLSKERPIPVVFAIVADGIGGHNAGEIASEIAVNTISSVVEESDITHPLKTLSDGIQQANTRIAREANSDETKKGMGSTCVCSLVVGNRLYIASMGDSRIYLIRDGNIRQLTTDHSWIQEAIEHGVISPEEAKGHPRAHVIHRYLGSNHAPDVDLRLRLSPSDTPQEARGNQGLKLLPNDRLLMCSDGLTDLVSDEEINQTLQESDSADEALQKLIDLANQRGGHDNITVVTLGVPGTKPSEFKLPRFVLPVSITAVIAVLSGVGIYFWKVNTADPTPTVGILETQPAVQEMLSATSTEESLPTLTASPSRTPGPSKTPWPTNTQKP